MIWMLLVLAVAYLLWDPMPRWYPKVRSVLWPVGACVSGLILSSLLLARRLWAAAGAGAFFWTLRGWFTAVHTWWLLLVNQSQ